MRYSDGVLVTGRPTQDLDLTTIWWEHVQASAEVRRDGHVLPASLLFLGDLDPGDFMSDGHKTVSEINELVRPRTRRDNNHIRSYSRAVFQNDTLRPIPNDVNVVDGGPASESNGRYLPATIIVDLYALFGIDEGG